MRAVSFGKLSVAVAGVPVKLGQSTLAGNMAASDATMSIVSASPFCQDMIPFKMDIDPGNTLWERVMVTSISGTTFGVSRGIDGTVPQPHVTGAVAMALFKFGGYSTNVVATQSGKAYFGKNYMVASTGVGVIDELCANPSAAVTGDDYRLFQSDVEGNAMNLTDYAVDVDVSGMGLYLTLWER